MIKGENKKNLDKSRKWGKIYKRDKIIEIIFKVGKPNFKERMFIKQCKKVNEPFPIKKIQIKWLKVR